MGSFMVACLGANTSSNIGDCTSLVLTSAVAFSILSYCLHQLAATNSWPRSVAAAVQLPFTKGKQSANDEPASAVLVCNSICSTWSGISKTVFLRICFHSWDLWYMRDLRAVLSLSFSVMKVIFLVYPTMCSHDFCRTSSFR